MSQYDVAVMGAGMVGATLANALALQGLRVVVVDRGPSPSFDADHYDLRVSALGCAAERVLRNLEVWPIIDAVRVSPYRRMFVWDAGSFGAIVFDAADVGESRLGHIVENGLVVYALYQRLRQSGNVRFLGETAVQRIDTSDAASVTVETDKELISAQLVVGADGAGSWVRQQLGIKSRRQDYHQRAIVAQVHTEHPHERTAWQRFLPTGPLAFLPLADGSSSIVWSCDQPLAHELMQLDDAAFRKRLADSFEHRLGDVTQVGPRKTFPLSSSQVAAYIADRCALVGDAAHTVHPLAGLGANLGIADAAVLAEVVADAALSGRNIGSRTVLRRYERWRRGENALVAYAIHGLQRLFRAKSFPLRGLRGTGLRLTDHAGPLKRIIVRRATGMGGDLPQLAKPSVSREDDLP